MDSYRPLHSNTLSMRLVSRIVWLAVWYAKSIHSTEPKQPPNVNCLENDIMCSEVTYMYLIKLFKKKVISRNCLMYFTKHTSKFDIHGHLITRISLRGWGCITIYSTSTGLSLPPPPPPFFFFFRWPQKGEFAAHITVLDSFFLTVYFLDLFDILK